ncbi:MAG: hypothetical protein GY697_22200 [Desulfobacterales bacterium]|nr:hypothetical protein [Desulfobacterales bacterium]
MKKYLIGYTIILTLFFGMAASATGAVNVAKLDLLQQKIVAIQTLQASIDDIRKQALALQGTLQDKIVEYTREIKEEKTARELATFKQALGVYRVRYNLKLVQQMSAYLAAVSERVDFFQDGREQIDFLYQQAQDDLKMVQTLSDMEIADFIRRMDQVLEKYANATNSSLFDIEKIQQAKLESIWKTISASK